MALSISLTFLDTNNKRISSGKNCPILLINSLSSSVIDVKSFKDDEEGCFCPLLLYGENCEFDDNSFSTI